MANTANNDTGKPGKGKPVTGKPGKGKPTPKQARAAKPGEKRGLMKFLKDVRIEMGKVTWPTRKDLMQSTLVVLVAVAIAAAYTSVLDFGFSKIVDVVINFIT